MCWEELSKLVEENFEFACGQGHVYHIECVKESFSDYITRGEISKLNCLGGCKVLATSEQIKLLFHDKEDLVNRH
jgi:hypothetical protein